MNFSVELTMISAHRVHKTGPCRRDYLRTPERGEDMEKFVRDIYSRCSVYLSAHVHPLPFHVVGAIYRSIRVDVSDPEFAFPRKIRQGAGNERGRERGSERERGREREDSVRMSGERKGRRRVGNFCRAAFPTCKPERFPHGNKHRQARN